ncbi:Ctr copper transporter family-domain-containing protein [Lipomyces tetrasporus]|uniref:Copper transport protein n=1 Tax=Lipomyces tetrasporus TaxID=54092 RepID=A0AAD7QRR8_9ASCO|nr:Ctr copper transporter family-domain-containing protein [Lipomyces tetrasporus]KAJ8100036.1 Ctr copper transporter family-domain-containing protein [Lipomyces tetrasporus]
MFFSWDANNICIVFQWWRIYNKVTLAFSFLGIVGLGIGYEFLREMTRRYEAYIATSGRRDELLPLIVRKYIPDRCVRDRLVLSLLYALQVLYSFFLMLVFMSYNGLMMLAVVVGAFIGFFFFGSRTRVPAAYVDDKDLIIDINNGIMNEKTNSMTKIMSHSIGTSAVRGGTCH